MDVAFIDTKTTNRLAEIFRESGFGLSGDVEAAKSGGGPTVYLAGPIRGCTDAECRNWREVAKLRLPRTLDPMDRDYRGREDDPKVAAEIVEGDKRDIDMCDVVLVNYARPSVGTSMEIMFAWQKGKRVVVWCDEDIAVSPWLLYHAWKMCHTLDEAIDACLEGW